MNGGAHRHKSIGLRLLKVSPAIATPIGTRTAKVVRHLSSG
jgi:hypothetical protein